MNGCADAVLAAVKRELDARRPHIDGANDIGEISVTVKLNAGTTWVRGIEWREERLCNRRERSPS